MGGNNRMRKDYRGHPLWYAYMLHRLSGLALALFLPFHFWLLSLALKQPEDLNDLLNFAENPLVKLAEFGLVFLLAIHAFGGVRIMAMEFLPWSNRQKTWAALALGLSLFISGIFFLRAI